MLWDWPLGVRTIIRPPPPMVLAAGCTTLSAKEAAIAASTALPPARRISNPASADSGCREETIPRDAHASVLSWSQCVLVDSSGMSAVASNRARKCMYRLVRRCTYDIQADDVVRPPDGGSARRKSGRLHPAFQRCLFQQLDRQVPERLGQPDDSRARRRFEIVLPDGHPILVFGLDAGRDQLVVGGRHVRHRVAEAIDCPLALLLQQRLQIPGVRLNEEESFIAVEHDDVFDMEPIAIPDFPLG